MNERIKELREQAQQKVAEMGLFENPDKFGHDPQRFNDIFETVLAELIVKECIEVALDERVAEEEIDKSDDIEDRCYLRGNNGGIVDAVVAIKQHFGVKE